MYMFDQSKAFFVQAVEDSIPTELGDERSQSIQVINHCFDCALMLLRKQFDEIITNIIYFRIYVAQVTVSLNVQLSFQFTVHCWSNRSWITHTFG